MLSHSHCIEVSANTIAISNEHENIIHHFTLSKDGVVENWVVFRQPLTDTLLNTPTLVDGSPKSTKFLHLKGIFVEENTIFVADTDNGAIWLITGNFVLD